MRRLDWILKNRSKCGSIQNIYFNFSVINKGSRITFKHDTINNAEIFVAIQCQNKLDGCFYAIKKIAFQDMKPELWFKVNILYSCVK